MSWLGKILAVLVLLLALVWMWFTVTVFAARTNWKTQAEAFKKGREEAVAARDSEYRTYLAEKDALLRQLKSEQAQVAKLTTDVTQLAADVAKNGEQIKVLNDATGKRDATITDLQASLAAETSRADTQTKRVNTLETEKVDDTIKREQAVKDKQAAETVARQATQDKLTAEKKLEEVSNLLADAKAQGFTGAGGSGGASLFANRPVPIREGTRGTIETYRDGSIQFTLGIDHGVTDGATLDVFRTGADTRYLGTVVVDRARPQSSVGTFRPADPRRPLRSLRPEELPKAGDRIGRIGSGPTP
ncbi:hypothetical protein [Urbifossiella limnaea]|uniref:Uncharacterized protein n=1 Tax=Urbifossiella limnaea TaxID=2528023 RepID=A0A517Y2U7_9BACT|nr:hypothetical protein [Urbifossiella limnaea]QDU24049.1 hypothetical protein ETAA1_60600 [Urbifossiella limnaea]